MAAAIVQSKTAQGGLVASLGATFNSTTVSGNLIIVAVSTYDGAAAGGHASAVTDNKGNTYTRIATFGAIGGGPNATTLYYCNNIVGGATHAVTFGPSDDASQYISIAISEVSGIAANNVPTSTTIGPSTSSPLTTSNLTTTGGALILGLYAFNAATTTDRTFTLGTNFTSIFNYGTNSSFPNMLFEYRVVASAGNYAASASISLTTGNWVGIAARFHEVDESQYARPSVDIAGGAWTDQAGGTTNLYATIDETVASDTDYLRSPSAPSSSVQEIRLSSIPDPVASTGHIARYRMRKEAAGNTLGVTVALVENTTVRASWIESNIGTAWTNFSRTLSAGEADSITDYGNLRLRFTATESISAPTYVGSGAMAATATSAATMAPALPTGWAADDIHVLIASTASNLTYGAITGWTAFTPGGTAENNGTGQRVQCWWRRAVAGDAAPTVPAITSTAVRTSRVFGVRGCPTSGDPFNVSGRSNNAASATVTFPDVTTTVANTLSVLAYTYVTDPTAIGTVSGFTAFNVGTTTLGADASLGMNATRTNASTGSAAGGTATVSGGTFTNSVNEGFHFAFAPANVAVRANVSWAEFATPAAGVTQVNKDMIAAWNLLKAISKDAQQAWHTRANIFDTQASNWHIRTPVNDDSISNWHTRNLVPKDGSSTWHTRALVPKDANSTWHTRSFTSKDANSTYHIRTALGKNVNTLWNLAQLVAQTRDATWNVRAFVADTQDSAWSIRTSVADDQASTWNILANVSDTVDTVWHTRQVVGSAFSSLYGIGGFVSKLADVAWNVRSLVTDMQDSEWSVRTSAFDTQDSTWHSRALVNDNSASDWHIRTTVPDTQTVEWHSRQLANKDVAITWNSIAQIAKDVALAWDIVAANLSVAKALTSEWNVFSLVADTQESDWIVRALAANQSESTWSVKQAVGVQRIVDWMVRATVPTTKASEWHIRTSLNDTQDTAWSVRTSAGKQFTSSWNIIQAIAKDAILAWNTAGSIYVVAKDAFSLWHTRATVAPTNLNSTWHDRTSLFDIQEIDWAIRNAIADTQAAEWSVRQLVQKDATHQWNTFATVIDTLNSLWHIRTSVSDTVESTWTIRQAIGAAITTLWDTAGPLYQVAKDLASLWYIRTVVPDQVTLDWHAYTSVAGTPQSTLWKVYALASSLAPSTWNTFATVVSSLVNTWAVRNTVNTTLISEYAIRTAVSEIVTLSWAVRARVLKEIVTTWGVALDLLAAIVGATASWLAITERWDWEEEQRGAWEDALSGQWT